MDRTILPIYELHIKKDKNFDYVYKDIDLDRLKARATEHKITGGKGLRYIVQVHSIGPPTVVIDYRDKK